MVSRPSVGAASAVSITAAMSATSIVTIESVRISVPRGSPSSSARCSARSTTPKAHQAMTAISQRKSAADRIAEPRSDSQSSPYTRNATTVPHAISSRATSSAFSLIVVPAG